MSAGKVKRCRYTPGGDQTIQSVTANQYVLVLPSLFVERKSMAEPQTLYISTSSRYITDLINDYTELYRIDMHTDDQVLGYAFYTV